MEMCVCVCVCVCERESQSFAFRFSRVCVRARSEKWTTFGSRRVGCHGDAIETKEKRVSPRASALVGR